MTLRAPKLATFAVAAAAVVATTVVPNRAEAFVPALIEGGDLAIAGIAGLFGGLGAALPDNGGGLPAGTYEGISGGGGDGIPFKDLPGFKHKPEHKTESEPEPIFYDGTSPFLFMKESRVFVTFDPAPDGMAITTVDHGSTAFINYNNGSEIKDEATRQKINALSSIAAKICLENKSLIVETSPVEGLDYPTPADMKRFCAALKKGDVAYRDGALPPPSQAGAASTTLGRWYSISPLAPESPRGKSGWNSFYRSVVVSPK